MAPPMMDAAFGEPGVAPAGAWHDASRWVELFREVAAGRTEPLGELYDMASRRLYGLALWRTGSRDLAAEVVQELFVRVAEHGERLASVRDPRWWLLSVTHRLAIDAVRRAARREAEPIEEPEPPRGLRGRALAAAAAAGTRRPTVDAWLRLWESRPLRLAWAAAVVLLVAANVALRIGPHTRPTAAPAAAALQERSGLKELQAIVELPKIRLHGTGIDLPDGRPAAPHVREPKTPHDDTEGKS